MSRLSRRKVVASFTAIGGLLIAGSARVIAQAQPLVVRRDIKDLQEKFPDELAKFIEAVKALRAKTVNGMSAWDFNADAHRIYCARDALEVHGTWWFMPWHRAYLHATERNLQLALGDKTVALPYWHWPITPGVPTPYRSAPLSHERFGENDPLQPIMLDLSGLAAPSFRGRVQDGALIEQTFGGNGATPNKALRSAIEGTPHGAVHNSVGSYLKNANGDPVDRNGNVVPASQAIIADMANLSRAAHDPIFFAHHANIDRLWEAWRTPSDSAHAQSEPWDTAEFVTPPFTFNFLDLGSSDPFQVTVARVRHTASLNYRYAAPGEGPAAPVTTSILVAEGARAQPDPAVLGSRTWRSTVPVSPQGPTTASTPAGSQRFVLLLTGVEVTPLGLDVAVYLTEKETAAFTPADGVYAGLLSVVSHGQPTKENLSMDVTAAMAQLRPSGSNVHVVLVPIKPATGNFQPRAPAVDRIELRSVR